MELTDKALKIITHYGFDKQKYIVIEEMSELIQAIIKLDRYKDDKEYFKYMDNFREELADVYLMILQLMLSDKEQYDIVKKIADIKADRQLERMEIENGKGN